MVSSMLLINKMGYKKRNKVFMNMEVKVCKKCLIEKPLDELVKRAGVADGRRALCKICYNSKQKDNRSNMDVFDKEKYKEWYKNYRKLNYDKITLKERKYQENNKEKEKNRKQKYREENREKMKNYSSDYRKKNKEKISENAKIYYQNNKNKRRVYENNKRKNDTNFKIISSVRSRINLYFKSCKIYKTNKTFDIVGCTPKLLKEHLEKQFKGDMSWDNYGLYGWHIDHIIPLSSANTEEEIYKLCHYTNLQPLWAEENIKKSNKILINN